MASLLKILYLGPTFGTSLDRANALHRLGHQVEHLDLRKLLPKTSLVDRLTWYLGGDLLSHFLMPNLSKALKDKQYDLILMDGNMPRMNGIQATIELRSRNYLMPIIAQSGYSSPEEVKEFKNSGMNDTLAKPIKGNALIDMITKYLPRTEG